MSNQPTPAERGLPELPEGWKIVGITEGHGNGLGDDMTLYTANQMREMYQRGLAARPFPSDWVAVPPGWKLVPVEPTEAMWGELARDLIMWLHMNDHTGAALYRHLSAAGREIPDWLLTEIPDEKHVPPKGDVAAAIYKAMVEAAPSAPAEAVQTAPEPLAQGDVVAYIESYEVGGVQRSGLVWADHPADTPGHTFKPLYASPQPAAEGCWPLNTKPENGWTFDPAFLERVLKLAEQQDSGGFAPSLEGVETVLLALQALATPNPPQPSASVDNE